MRRLLKNIVVFLVMLQYTGSLFSQSDNALLSDTKREEIQRYFGYEILPFRYLTLPYDASINTNQAGDFVEIGFLFLLFIPILVLVFLRRNVVLYIVAMLSFLFLFIIGAANSHVFSHTLGAQNVLMKSSAEYREYLFGEVGWLTEPTAHISAYLYTLAHIIYQPIENLLLSVSGDSDSITYPLLFALFITVTLVMRKKMTYDGKPRALLLMIFWVNLFFWVAFSAGIVWYGFVNLILGFFVIYFLLQKLDYENKKLRIFIRSLFYVTSVSWVIAAIVLRISQVSNNAEATDLGKAMMNPVFYRHQVGELSKIDVLNSFYPGFDKALARINSETESKILRIGTSFSFFIKNNNDRVFIDNQLGLWSQLKDRYEKKNLVSDVMKANNIKYIIVDLNTPFIDKTPEKSLEKKFKLLTRWLRDHQRLKLISTNRVVIRTNAQGQQQYHYGMFGEQIYYGGQYAIYEIL